MNQLKGKSILKKFLMSSLLIGAIAGSAPMPSLALAQAPKSGSPQVVVQEVAKPEIPADFSAPATFSQLPTSIIESSGPWYKKTYTIYLNRSETKQLADAPSKLIDRIPVPWLAKAVFKAYVWLLQSTARNAYNSGRCVLLLTTVYGGWASPPGAAAYTNQNCR